jgi:hypothetical protein
MYNDRFTLSGKVEAKTERGWRIAIEIVVIYGMRFKRIPITRLTRWSSTLTEDGKKKKRVENPTFGPQKEGGRVFGARTTLRKKKVLACTDRCSPPSQLTFVLAVRIQLAE